jgi:glycerol-3-phosphate dehydrogenase
VHGGLRYLEMLDFRLVHEALQERGLLLQRLAPHLVKPVPFLYPLKHRWWERFYAGAGVALYDAMALSSGLGAGLPLHKHLTRRGAMRLAPSLKKSALVGALQYYDAQVDDARHTMELARTAASYGAHVANRVKVTGFLRQGERVTGVQAKDLESGREFEVRAQQVVNATGVWTDDTQAMVGERGQYHVRASKGIHLVVPKDRIQSSTGMILRTEKSVLFIIPWGRHWLIGTTDTDWNLDKAHPAATSTDIDYILDHVNAVIATPLTREDVEGVYAGLRPLLAGESESTSKLSREHVVAHAAPGLVVVAGGKYTTYRVMAKDAIDAAANALDERVPKSITRNIPLVGAEGYQAMWNQRHLIAQRSGLHVARIEHLLNRYGALTDEVLELVAKDPKLGEQLPGTQDYLQAEVVYAAASEGARHLDDVLARRTRISIEAWDRGVGAADAAARLMAPVLGWSEQEIEREVSVYLRRVQSERASQDQLDDESADKVRLEAPDIVSPA